MMLRLLTSRRLGPLFVAQSLGALNDNMFKNALVILLVFHAGSGGAALAAAASGTFILPYILLGAPAGQLADRFDKGLLLRLNKTAEVVVMALGTWALMAHSTVGLLAALFALGVQATGFGPLKYGILPELLSPPELITGNALMEGGYVCRDPCRHDPGGAADRA